MFGVVWLMVNPSESRISTLSGRRLQCRFVVKGLPSKLDDLRLDVQANLILRQDGAAAHTAMPTIFARLPRWRFFQIDGQVDLRTGSVWPAAYRSPDLAPFDRFRRGHSKTVTYDVFSLICFLCFFDRNDNRTRSNYTKEQAISAREPRIFETRRTRVYSTVVHSVRTNNDTPEK